MRETIEFLKRALNRTPNAGVFGYYHIADGFAYAQNGHMQAVAPIDTSESFSVAGEELEAAFARITTEPHIEFKGTALVVKAGRLKATVPCIHCTPPGIASRAESEWKDLPQSVVPALIVASKFLIGTGQGWTQGIRLMTGRLTTVNNFCGLDIALPDWESPASILTKESVEFLAADPPGQYAHVPGGLQFRWLDERSVQCQLIDQEMPKMVDEIFAKAGQDAVCEITPEWRSAFADAAAVTDEKIELCRTHMTAIKGATRITIDVETDVPEGHASIWSTKVLTPMVEIATHWNPNAWPSPALFRGNGLYGVVIGRK